MKHILILLSLIMSNLVAWAQDNSSTLTITTQPVAITIAQKEQSVTLTCIAENGSSAVSYQWFLNTDNTNTGGAVISGANSSEYTTKPFNDKEIRYYYCVATVGEESVTSNVAVAAYTGLPVLYVETPDQIEITSKEVWTEHTLLTLTNCEDESWDFENLDVAFRGRGNTTWSQKKKPYTFKTTEKKSIMGMPKSKRWVLIANYLDNSFLKNHLAFYLSDIFEMSYTVKGQFVDLVFNGVYRGLYWLGEAIKVESNRINIKDGDKNITDDDDKDYLIEMDTHYDEPVKFKTPIRQLPYMIKNDDYMVDDEGGLTSGGKARLARLQKKIAELEWLLYPDYVDGMNTDNCSAPDENYTKIIEVYSWAKFWLVNEIMDNVELGNPKSAYFTFECTKDDIFMAGPVWDFDWSTLSTRNSIRSQNVIYYNALFKSPTFLAALEEIWDKYSAQIDIVKETDRMRAILRVAAAVDRAKWGIHNDPSQSASKGDFDAYVDFLQTTANHKNSVVNKYVTETLPQVTINGALTITTKSGVTTVDINGDSDKPLIITESFTAKTVTYRRSFKENTTSTVMLPFEVSTTGKYGSFYTMKNITSDESDVWTITTSDAPSKLLANTPYMFKPSCDFIKIDFENVEFMKTEDGVTTFGENGEWKFQGVYSLKEWAQRTPTDFGFAAAKKQEIEAGQFVRAGEKSKIKATRAYLTYDEKKISKSATSLPDKIIVLFPDETEDEEEIIVPVAEDEEISEPVAENEEFLTPVSEIVANAGVKVWSYEKTIFIAASAGQSYRVIDLNGRTLKTGITSSNLEEVTLNRSSNNIVIVITGNQSHKIMY